MPNLNITLGNAEDFKKFLNTKCYKWDRNSLNQIWRAATLQKRCLLIRSVSMAGCQALVVQNDFIPLIGKTAPKPFRVVSLPMTKLPVYDVYVYSSQVLPEAPSKVEPPKEIKKEFEVVSEEVKQKPASKKRERKNAKSSSLSGSVRASDRPKVVRRRKDSSVSVPEIL